MELERASVPSNLIWQRPYGYLVRHGSTEANAENCFRGWIDFPLDDEGREAGIQLQNFFAYEKLGRIISSDLSRSQETAQYILDAGCCCCPYITPEAALRPWNIGDFAGQKKTAKVEAKFRKFIENPELVIPDGESLNEFRNRNDIIMDFFAVPYDGHPNVVVAHTSNITSIQHLADETVGQRPEEDELVQPGGVVAVHMIDGKLKFVAVLGASKTSESLGVS